jgi:vacuolar-type H+-ATPase subunit H
MSNDMIDNTEIENVLTKLEEIDDEVLAVELLKEFNDSTRELGRLLLNQDDSLNHEEWKTICDKAKNRVDTILKKINSL